MISEGTSQRKYKKQTDVKGNEKKHIEIAFQRHQVDKNFKGRDYQVLKRTMSNARGHILLKRV